MNNLVISLTLLLSYIFVDARTHFEIWIDSIENDSGGKSSNLYAKITCYGVMIVGDFKNQIFDVKQTDAHDIENGATQKYEFYHYFARENEWYDHCMLQLFHEDNIELTENQEFVSLKGVHDGTDFGNLPCDEKLHAGAIDETPFELKFNGEYAVKYFLSKHGGDSCPEKVKIEI